MQFNAKEIWLLIEEKHFKETNICDKDNCPFLEECNLKENREQCLICSVLGFVEEVVNENIIKVNIEKKYYLYEVYSEEQEQKDLVEYGIACGCVGFPKNLLAVDEDIYKLQKIAKEQKLNSWVILDNND